MKRALKWIVGLLLAVVLVVVVAVGAILWLVDPNQFRDEIAAQVQKTTGRELVIEGDIDLTFFPWLGLSVGKARLADAPGFGTEPFMEIERARLAVELMPLLDRRVVLDKIVLEGPKLRLIRNREGRGNWQQLAERLQRNAETPAPETPPPQEQAGGAPVVLESLGGVEIRDGMLLWEDRQAGSRYLLEPLTVDVAHLNLDRPIPVEARWVLQGKDAPRVQGQFKAELSYDQAAKTLTVPKFGLDLDASGESVPGGRLAAAIEGALRADLQAERYVIPELTIQTLGLVAKAQGEVRLPESGPVITAQLSLPPFNPRETLKRLGIEPPRTADNKALETAALQTQLKYSDGGLALDDLQLKLDQSTLTGQARLRSFSPVAGSFRAEIDQLNLDRYLPPEQEKPAAGAPAPKPTAQTQEEELPLEALRKLDLDGRVSVKQLTVRGLQAKDVQAELHAQGGQIRLDPVTAQLYEGRYRGAMRLDATGPRARVGLNHELAGIQSGPLLKDLIGDDKVLGRGTIQFSGTAQGVGGESLLSSLNGQGSFRFEDGAVKGVNVAQEIREAQALLGKTQAAPAAESPSTDFSAMTGTLTVENGVARNKDFLLQSPLMRVTGEGKLNLLERELSYLLTVNLVKTLAGQGGPELAKLQRIPIPLRITGSIDDLRVKVDLKEALMQAQGERIEAEKQKLRAEAEEEVEKARKRFEQQAGEKLKDLFKR